MALKMLRNFGLRIGLGIEAVNMTQTPAKEKVNDGEVGLL